MRMLRLSVCTLPLLLAVTACGSSRGASGKGAVAQAGAKPQAPTAASCSEAGRTADARPSDVDGDGRPDIMKYYAEGSDPQKPGERKSMLVREDIDLNWDNKLDICRFYDPNGKVSKEELDLDFDGKIDEVRTYEDGVLVLVQRDRNNDGRFDIVRRYKDGKLAQKETDTNDDGQVDRWEYYDGNVLDRIGVDVDHDGKVDRWSKAAR